MTQELQQDADDAATAVSDDTPAVPKRGEALGCGWGCGTVAVAVPVVVAILVAHDPADDAGAGVARWLAAAGAVAVIVGFSVRAYAAAADRKTHRRERAPRLPVALAAPDEPVWITGTIVCPEPVFEREFGVPCVWLRIRVVQGSGKHRRTLRDERLAARAWLADGPDDGAARVELDLSQVALQQIPSWTAAADNVTTTVTFLAADGTVSACGILRRESRRAPPRRSERSSRSSTPPKPGAKSVVDVDDAAAGRASTTGTGEPLARSGSPGPDDVDGALVLGGEDDLPLLVTPLTRHAWTEYAETEELRTRTIGTAFLTCGTAVTVAALGALAGDWRIDSVRTWIAGLVGALLLVVPWIGYAALRRVRECRTRAEVAAAALEADLARAAEDPNAAGLRVAARLAVYDQLATEHNELLHVAPMTWVGRFVRCEPLPIHGDGDVDGGARGAPPDR